VGCNHKISLGQVVRKTTLLLATNQSLAKCRNCLSRTPQTDTGFLRSREPSLLRIRAEKPLTLVGENGKICQFWYLVDESGESVNGFLGRYATTMDDKGRCILPAKLRAVVDDSEKSLLDGEVYLTKGLEGCLSVYPACEWSAIQQRLSTLDFTDKAFRSFSRRFYSMASPATPDKNGRILIPSNLAEDAGLEKNLVVIGVNRWIEIWSPQLFDYYLKQHAGSFEEVAERLFSGDGRSAE